MDAATTNPGGKIVEIDEEKYQIEIMKKYITDLSRFMNHES